MKPIDRLFSDSPDPEGLRKVYVLGYRAGYEDAITGKGKEGMQVPSDPIEALELSTRAQNCLHFAGCRYITDVTALQESKIRQMRNLGRITANEIALALHKRGITGTDWDLFLL